MVTNTEIVSVRTTLDGARVQLHANGEVSFRTHYARGGALPVATMWRHWQEVCVLNADEIPAFIRQCKRRVRAIKPARRSAPADVAGSSAARLRDLRAHMEVCRMAAGRCKVCG